ncbi:glycosyltransferase family 4 protein [Microbacterium sp.]|uniref:glycosyltransferase family 4 protein n=1 Tax=Microbacterium sp. TaxID=51671 RepID=UPI0028115C0F|nr:glycosyltransferase family 4 protein [Microbacterium sp.]
MRVLVTPHHFEIGGSQINALEYAEAVANMPGFDVAVYAPDGVLVDDARARGLELHLTKLNLGAPSPRRIREMTSLVRRLDIDLVHSYEWPTTMDAMLGPNTLLGTPMLASENDVQVTYFLPKSLPMTVCMNSIYEEERAERPDLHLLEVPVDTTSFSPDTVSDERAAAARRECGADDDELLVVVVSRISAHLKIEGLHALAAAAGRLGRDHRFRVAVVGDGPLRPELERTVAAANAQAGRDVVVLLGERSDPRPYYRAADIAVGMGGSALRAMAFGKPLLVQGQQAFWSLLDETTQHTFFAQGWYGLADGVDGVGRCADLLKRLLEMSQDERARLGALGRRIVRERYSLQARARQLADLYTEVHARGGRRTASALRALGTTARLPKFYAARTLYGWRARRAQSAAGPQPASAAAT